MSSTQRMQDELFAPGRFISSKRKSYLIQSVLGEGSFGIVLKCLQLGEETTVAIKVLKKAGSYKQRAKEEVNVLTKLMRLDVEKYNLVQVYSAFVYRGFYCIVFEYLDKSLFDFVKENSFRPLTLKEIRAIVQQLAVALEGLKSLGIIHCDIKMENVMLVNHEEQPFRVKLIDFGLATEVSAAEQGTCIQTRYYRSPEILLGLPFTESIDMWSLGCLAASLYLGTYLYPGSTEYDMMRYIVATQGQPPDKMLDAGLKTHRFFENNHSTNCTWKLKTASQYYRDTGQMWKETRILELHSLNDLLRVNRSYYRNCEDKVTKRADRLFFVSMVKMMLQLDATQRITPSELLQHTFVTCDIGRTYRLNPYILSSYKIMTICSMTPIRREVFSSMQTTSRKAHHHPSTAMDLRIPQQEEMRPAAPLRGNP